MRTFYITMLAFMLVAPVAAMADHHGDKDGGDHKRKFETVDTNGDGFLTRVEMEAHHREKLNRMFENADTNKDGKLSREELHKGREEWRAKMRERFEKMKERRDSMKKDKTE